MPDPRFFEDLGPVTLAELAKVAGARMSDPAMGARTVSAVAVLARARPDTVTFLTDRKYAEALAQARPSGVFVSERDLDLVPEGCVALVTPTAHAGYALAADRLHRPRRHLGPEAVSRDAVLEEGVVLAPGAVIGPGARIGRGTEIGANAVIGPGVAIGRDCFVGAGASLGFALLGDRVRILAGARIGEPGFGATGAAQGVIDVPQLGRVILQDGVTIGANSCVDRGAFEDTVVGENTKIDNLVHIAHNVVIGRHCLIMGQVGFAGSTHLGDYSVVASQSGIAGHLKLGPQATVGAKSGVMRDIPPKGTVLGMPAMPDKQTKRQWIALQQLPETLRRIRDLEKLVAQLSGRSIAQSRPDRDVPSSE